MRMPNQMSNNMNMNPMMMGGMNMNPGMKQGMNNMNMSMKKSQIAGQADYDRLDVDDVVMILMMLMLIYGTLSTK